MSFSEGASYRINIVGEDSSMILDSYTSRVKATIVGSDNTVLVDKDTNTILATLSANIIDTDGNVAYNTATNSFSGNLLNDIGGIAYNKDTSTFYGNFRGTLRAADGDVIVNNETKQVYGDFQGDLYNANGIKVYDSVTDNINVTSITGSGSGLRNVDADTLDGLAPSFYLDWNNITNKPSTMSGYGITDGNVGSAVVDEDDPALLDLELSITNTLTRSINETRAYVNDTVDELRGSAWNLIYNGDTVLDVEKATFYGTVIGDVRTPEGAPLIEDGFISASIRGAQIFDFSNNLVIDANSKSLHANIYASDSSMLLDFTDRLLIGNVEGNIYNSFGLVLDSENAIGHIDVSGNIINKWGSYAYDKVSDIFSGAFKGHIVNDNGDLVIDTNNAVYLPLSGNIVDDDGMIHYDSITNTFSGSFIGNLSNTDGDTIVDVFSKNLRGNLTGNMYNADGQIIIDHKTDVFYGTLRGRATGLLVNEDSFETVFDITDSRFYTTVSAPTFRGDFAGNLVDADGVNIITYSSGDINANQVTGSFVGNVTGDVLGDVTGSLYNDEGTCVLNVRDGSFKGIITNHAGDVLFDQSSINVADGNFGGNVTANQLKTAGVTIDSTINLKQPVDREALVIECLPLSGRLHSTNLGILLRKSAGTLENPLPTEPGDQISFIGFGSRTVPSEGDEDWDYDFNYSMTGAIGFRVDAEADVSTYNMPGEFVVTQCYHDGIQRDSLTVNAHGQTTATLKDLTVVGETGNTPTNTTTPVQWLEVTVNGETRYMPLYT